MVTLVLLFAASSIMAGDLPRSARSKISAGDILSCQHLVEDYKNKVGVDAEYLDAIGWVARGAEMLGRNEIAALYVAELRRRIIAPHRSSAGREIRSNKEELKNKAQAITRALSAIEDLD